jgi:hypothetical protein
MKVLSGRSPRLKPGVKTAPLTPGFSPGLLRVTFAVLLEQMRVQHARVFDPLSYALA